jgi:hypothetical protein
MMDYEQDDALTGVTRLSLRIPLWNHLESLRLAFVPHRNRIKPAFRGHNKLTQASSMFSLNPDGGGESSSRGSTTNVPLKFFARLFAGFVAIRLVHVLWGDSTESPKAIKN